MEPKLSITAWYVSRQRFLELVDRKTLDCDLRAVLLEGAGGPLAGGILAGLIGAPIMDWIQRNDIQPFHTLATTGALKEGMIFFYKGHLYSRGFGERNQTPNVFLWENVSQYLPGYRLEIHFSKDGIPTSTGHGELAGSRNLFSLCRLVSLENGVVRCVPVVIGDVGMRTKSGVEFPAFGSMRIDLSTIDQFSAVDFLQRPSAKDLDHVRKIPEKIVKKTLCAMLGEDLVPSDWGGEENDVFSSNVSISGKRIPTAFLLKGPSRFHQMKLTDCGKNADQIVRLFHAPAELFVVQHCHKIGPEVLHTVEAFVMKARLSRRAHFALIDGHETCRILESVGLVPKRSTRRAA